MNTTSSLSALALSLAAALAAQAADSTPATPALMQRLAKRTAAVLPDERGWEDVLAEYGCRAEVDEA